MPVPLSDDAWQLYVEGLIFSAETASHGLLSARAMAARRPFYEWRDTAVELVDFGYWQETEDGWRVLPRPFYPCQVDELAVRRDRRLKGAE